jgi:hypothetical protein
VDNYRLTKRSSNRAAVKAYIKAQVLRAATRYAGQRGAPFKMYLETGMIQQQRISPPRADPSKQPG